MRKLKAYTIVELLIVMIISGVIFLSMLEGFELFKWYSALITRRMSTNRAFSDGYYRLESIVTEADSVEVDFGNIKLNMPDGRDILLLWQDSMLIENLDGHYDTLLTNIVELRSVSDTSAQNTIDTLIISVKDSDKEVRNICFGIKKQRHIQTTKAMVETELDYAYEKQ